MKICPFCAEEIQDAAIKCRYCGEFLEAPPQHLQARPNQSNHPSSQPKWYQANSFIIVLVLMLGPLALPAIWFHPKYKPVNKAIITVCLILLTYICTEATISMYHQFMDSFKTLGL